MKKAFGILLFLFIILNSAEAFFAQRIYWWTLRLDELESKKKGLERQKKSQFDTGLSTLFDKDSARCRETIEVLKKNTTVEGTPLTIESIRSNIHQSLLPIYSLRFFEIITERAGRESSRTKSKSVLNDTLKHVFFEDAKGDETSSPQNLFAPTLSAEEADLLALELTIGSIMEQFDPLYRKIAEAIEQDIIARGKKQGDTIEIPNLSALIRQKAAEKYLEIEEPTEYSAALQKSGTWKRFSDNFTHAVSLIDEVRQYLDNAGTSSSVEKARYYLRNIASLDKIVFDAESEKAITELEGKLQSRNFTKSAEIFAIPAPGKILGALDTRRRKLLSGIAGNENREFFEKATAALDETAAHCLRASEKAIESCKKTECAASSEILEAQEKISELRNFASSYIEKSITFLEWASKSRSVDPKRLLDNHRYFTERIVGYMNFLRSLSEKSIPIALFDNPELHLKFVVGVKKSSKVLAILQQIKFPENSLFQSLADKDINKLKKYRTQLAETAQRTQRDINTALASYQSRMNELAKKRHGKNSKLDAGIAQFDMDQLIMTLREYASYYSTLVYADTALKRYAEEYRAVESPHDSTDEHTRARAIRQGRLIPLIADFDSAKIRHEFTVKNYLRKEIRSLMAKVRSLAVFYRQNGFSVGSLFTSEDSDRIAELLDRQSRVEVADWVMTEINFEEIDRKAVKKLAFSAAKKDWKLDEGGKFINTEKTEVLIEPPGIRMRLPGAWIEEPIDEYLSERKISKAYRSRDGSVSLYISTDTLPNGTSLHAHSAAWHNKLGSKIVKSASGQLREFDYHWILARDPKNRVRESYAIKFGDKAAIIISGQSPKDRYNFFHKKMELIKESVRKIEPSQTPH